MIKTPNPSEVVQELFSHHKEILKNINQESVDVYLWLKNEYKKGNIKDNTVFQFVFRSYYRLDNAGLGEKLKRKYFELLNRKENKLETILHGLYIISTDNGNNTVQFSFATKLLHTIDNSKPIFDKEVSAVIHKAVIGNNGKEKRESAKRIYVYLENLYSILAENKKCACFLISDLLKK